MARYKNQGAIHPANPGTASTTIRATMGGWWVTAKVDPARKAVPRMPVITAQIRARAVRDSSSWSSSRRQASKWRCSRVSSILLTIFRSRRSTSFPLFFRGWVPGRSSNTQPKLS